VEVDAVEAVAVDGGVGGGDELSVVQGEFCL
jgi:hypothetical protein